MTEQTSSSNARSLTLRVAEAQAKDGGRGIARLDPQDLQALGAQIGDILEVVGTRRTAVKAMPAYRADRGQTTLQIDGIVRENAGVGLDQKATVRAVAHQPARSLTLAPLSSTRARSARADTRYLGRLLEGQPLMAGDRVRIDLLGTGAQDFRVADVSPPGVVLVVPGTRVLLKGDGAEPERAAAVSYEDIGGLHREIQRIREMIELPLKYPEVFERLGIDAPRGVLLHGPPGCGKTLIARAVASETSAHFTHIAGPEIMAKFYGEAEANLRVLFDDAGRHAPAIIFIDEIDAIAPKREEMAGDKQVERRVVSQLLALMDGLKERGQIIVIGATNLPNTLDPALRRPGRFDREIVIGIPDARGRREILDIHTRGMPLAEASALPSGAGQAVDLERLARTTHGFVGADLEALCREAAMIALRRLMPTIDFAAAHIPYEKLVALNVTMQDFLAALGEVEPSAIREVFTEVPDVTWEDVGGLERVKQTLLEAVEWPLKYGHLFAHAGAAPPKGILLQGPPGCGKTLLAKAVAHRSEANFIAVKGPALMSMYVGESERGVREVFKKARQAQPCIVFFDEIDARAPRRGAGAESGVAERVVSQMLTELDGIEELRGVMVLAATNRPDRLDPALLRPGRFDLILEIAPPDTPARRAIFAVHTRGKPLADDVDLDRWVEATAGLVGADIEGLCRRAALLSIREYIEARGEEAVAAPGQAVADLTITARHFEQAMVERQRVASEE